MTRHEDPATNLRTSDVTMTHVKGGHVWWYVVRRFEKEDDAKRRFDLVNEAAAKLEGEAQIAGYRILDDLPPDGKARIVVVCGQIEDRVRDAAILLGGEPWDLHPNHVHGLVYRRVRFLEAAREAGAKPGVYTKHHEGGLWLDDEGRVVK